MLGLWLACTIFFAYKDALFMELDRLQQGKAKDYTRYVYWGLGVFFLVFLLQLSNYFIISP